MFYFLTSSPLEGRPPVISNKNDFRDELVYRLQGEAKGLFICSDPYSFDRTDAFAEAVRTALEDAGIAFLTYNVLDARTSENASELVKDASFIVLAGGHVPTQNAFFRSIDLRLLLESFRGVLVGISAGTMNSARIVYSQPELDGEATDPEYLRFLQGLNVTRTMIIPHYQMTKDYMLDGMRLFEDITYPDSFGHRFHALCDGSYIMGDGSQEMLCGEAYLISGGTIEKICSDGEKIYL